MFLDQRIRHYNGKVGHVARKGQAKYRKNRHMTVDSCQLNDG
jgi:hypothetical protein